MLNIYSYQKKSHRHRITRSLNYLFLILSILILSGCAAPKVTVNPDTSIGEYNKYKVLYLLAPDTEEEDPRHIFPQVVNRLEGLGFHVKPINKENPLEGGQGTGFIVDSNGYVLTCAHIFEKQEKASLWIKGKRFAADVISTDKEKDLALLKIPDIKGVNLQSLPISKKSQYKMGQDVYTIGFPLSDILGNSPRLNKGLVSSTVGLKDNPDHLQISVEIQSGNSGSPLLNEDGEVIGVIQSTLNPMNVLQRTGGTLPQNVNFAAKTNIIEDFINQNNNDITLNLDSETKLEFDQVSESVVQIRAGDITEEFLKQRKMLCKVAYQSFWDLWFRFRFFHMEFYDLETGDLLFKAGQYRDTVFTTEAKVMDETFEQIRNQFQF